MPFRTLKLATLPLLTATLLAGCAGSGEPPLTTVERVDLERYGGTWYEIARLPQWFQRGCYNSTATYTLEAPHRIGVVNRCQRKDGPSEATGTARALEGSGDAKLKVRFDNWFSRLLPRLAEGNYWVLALDQDYQTVVVGGPSRDYLWILARQPRLPEDRYQALVEVAREKGFPVEELKRNRDLVPTSPSPAEG